MPFVFIINASLILTGKRSADDSQLPIPNTFDLKGNDLAYAICEELVTGARLGKIAATEHLQPRRHRGDPTKYGIDIYSKVDLDDARAFLVHRGLLEARPSVPKGRRENQLDMLQLKARELSIDLKKPKAGDKAALRDALQAEYPSFFSNFEDIWKSAKTEGIASPISQQRRPPRPRE